MRKRRLLPSVVLLSLSSVALFAQQPGPPRPAPTIPTGPREPQPPGPKGVPPLPDPCQDITNQPLITLALSPAEIYREDSITASWEVRDRRPGVQWGYPVHLETFGPQPRFPDPAPRAGSHTYTTPSVSGRVTLKTRCGEKRVDWERIPDASLEAVEPARGAPGSRVRLRGSQFGNAQGRSHAEIVRGNQAQWLDVVSWGNGLIEVTVPEVPTGPATVRVVKGGRRPTAGRGFRVVKSFTVDSAVAGAALTSLAIPPTFVHLSDGSNASNVTLPAAVVGGDPAFNFTLAALDIDIPPGAKVAQSIALPGTGFPMRIKYQVNDLNSNGISASVAGGQIVLSVGFEGGGSEIKGRVRYCDVGAFGACASASWKDSLAPDIQIENARATFRLTPRLTRGALELPPGQFAFDTDVQSLSAFENWLVPSLRRWTNETKETARNSLNQRLNTAAVRGAIASAVTGRLRAADPSFTTILSITPSGGSIVIEYE